MRKTSKLILVSGVLAALAVPSAAMADTTVPYTGQGTTNGVINNQPVPANDGGTGQFTGWIGGNADGDYDEGEGYILWILSANGAKTATLTADGKAYAMKPFGGQFKVVTPYLTPEQRESVTADYTGSPKGGVKLTISHGSVVFDTNIPANTWTTADGGTVPGDFGTNPVFAYKQTQNRNYSWQCSNGEIHTSVQHLVFTWNVDATPILGNNTGNVVGYQLTGSGAAGPGENYRTGEAQGTCPDGGSRTQWVTWDPATDPSTAVGQTFNIPFVDNIKSGLVVNGEWLPTTV